MEAYKVTTLSRVEQDGMIEIRSQDDDNRRNYQPVQCTDRYEQYERKEIIGKGMYGEVFKGHLVRRPDQLVAMKKVRTRHSGVHETTIREIEILKQMQHENIIKLRAVVRSAPHPANNMLGSVYLVLEYMDRDLHTMLQERGGGLSLKEVQLMMKQLLQGVAECHANGVLHLDLKPANILTNDHGTLKIADFGLAHRWNKSDNAMMECDVVTHWYRPPELLLGATKYGPEVDMWSVGCVFAELLIGKPLFPGKDDAEQLLPICKILGCPTEANMPCLRRLSWRSALEIHKKYKENRLRSMMNEMGIHDRRILDLLSAMLKLDPMRRITASRALKNDYFSCPKRPMANAKEAESTSKKSSFLESLLKGGAKKSRKSRTTAMPKRAADQKRLVWNGVLLKTRSGLTIDKLAESKSGQIVSKAKQANGIKRMAAMRKEGTAAPPFKKKSKR